MIVIGTKFGETFILNMSINEFHTILTNTKSDHVLITPMSKNLEHTIDDIIVLKQSINHVWVYDSYIEQ